MSQQQHIAAFIYDKRGRVISIGQNSYIKTHPLQARHANKVGEEHKIFLHAEIAAISKCKDLTKAHRLVIIRYDRHGNPAMAKPCKVCQSAIAATSIKIIEHT